jgi:hypothetical protein
MKGRKVPDEGDPRGLYTVVWVSLLAANPKQRIVIVIAIAGFPHSRGGSTEITGTAIQRDPTLGLAFWTRWTDQISFLATGDSVITVYPLGLVIHSTSRNGTEYTNKQFDIYIKQYGIIHAYTPAYTKEPNGLAERIT